LQLDGRVEDLSVHRVSITSSKGEFLEEERLLSPGQDFLKENVTID
jgi:hypothetical protein